MKEATHISSKEGSNKAKRLQEIAASSLKLGTIGFGGIAGMVATIENEMVVRRKWIDHQHFMDVLSTSYIIPGPNAVEVVMHCGKERGGQLGLVVAGVCYILPAMIICLVLGHFYQKYNTLPEVQDFLFGLRPAITALVFATVFRLSNKALKNNNLLIVLCLLVFAGSLYDLNEILLILSAGAIYYAAHQVKKNQNNLAGITFITFFLQVSPAFSENRLFLIFLKIGAVLYGSGYVLFAYMDESLVRHYHWLNHQQLTDAIAVGQITPGPILSSATFAGYLIDGISGGIIATIGIFLPSFFISFFLHHLLSRARKSKNLRLFLDGLNAASIGVIAVVGIHLFSDSVLRWQGTLLLAVCFALAIFPRKLNTLLILLIGSLGGFFLLRL